MLDRIRLNVLNGPKNNFSKTIEKFRIVLNQFTLLENKLISYSAFIFRQANLIAELKKFIFVRFSIFPVSFFVQFFKTF